MKKKRIIICVAVIALLAGIFAGIYFVTKPDTSPGTKVITIDVIADGKAETFEIKTDAQYLKQALEQEHLIDGRTDAGSFFVTTVNGYTADTTKEEWWCLSKGGEMLMTGLGDTAIANGDEYELTLTVGYDFDF